MKNNKYYLNQSGFTLLELMISITIAGIIFTGMFIVFSKVFNVAEKIFHQTDIVQNGQRIVLQMTKDLESYYAYNNSSNIAVENNSFKFTGRSPNLELLNNNATLMTFPSFSSLSFGQSTFPARRINKISYILQINSSSERSKEHTRFNLIRQELPFVDIPGEPRITEPIVMSDRVKKISISFLGKNFSAPQMTWNLDPLKKDKGPPQEVLIDVTLQGKKGKEENIQFSQIIKGS